MEMFAFACVVVFWSAVMLALTSIATPNAAFLCKTKSRVRGLASWLIVAFVAGSLNYTVAGGVNNIFG